MFGGSGFPFGGFGGMRPDEDGMILFYFR